MLRQIKPKNARSKRALEKREPQLHENTKIALFLRYTSCSEVTQLVMKDFQALKAPLYERFEKKNNIHPFEDPSSLEFFSEKNDVSLFVYGSHSKKRPHCLTLARMFHHKLLDMVELRIDAETLRTLNQFKCAKPARGLKPLISFSGTAFESPIPNSYTLARSILLDMFRGEDTNNVDVEGLQYVIHFTVGEESETEPTPKIRMRCYMIKTKKSGHKMPRVEVEEMGPRIDFHVGRIREADPDMLKEAMKKPRGLEAREKKNIQTDIIGDKVGRIHVGKQDIAGMQTRKMKGLKRSRGGDDDDEDEEMADDSEDGGVEVKKSRT